MNIYGLIGYPLGHSFSAGYFAKKFEKENIENSEYKNFPIENIELLNSIVSKTEGLKGLNVTIPYKQQVIPFLTAISDDAQTIGAVNTIKIETVGGRKTLKGFNTDVYGFQQSLQPHLKNFHNKALVLGSGGASKAVEFVLNKLSIEYVIVSRNPSGEGQIAYTDLTQELIQSHLLVINTTPMGMYPKVDTCPEIPYNLLTKKHILFDLVYNPEETLFMKKGKEKGAFTLNGLEMLHLQAEKAWEIWNS
jgi:shikimate dehydrogenase